MKNRWKMLYMPFWFKPYYNVIKTYEEPLKSHEKPWACQDVPMIDQTFGFDTACTEATKAVNSAYVEAKGNATEAAMSCCLQQEGLGG